MALLLACLAPAGCASWYRHQADGAAWRIIDWQQKQAFGKTQPFTVEPASQTLRRRLLLDQDLPVSGSASRGVHDLPKIDHWPEKDYPAQPDANGEPEGTAALKVPKGKPLRVSLTEALRIAAENNRDYQSRKEEVFQAALDLDLESNEFRGTFLGTLDTLVTEDLRGKNRIRGWENGINLGWQIKLKTGAQFTANLAIDLVKLLVPKYDSGYGILADASVTIPLLRGAGIYVVTEPMTQAQRNVLYALYRMERYRKTLVVSVTSDYLDVLRAQDTVDNQEQNYRNLVRATRSARALATGERWELLRVDQARQDELRARERWILAQQSYAATLDRYKLSLGLPVDAHVELDRSELQGLAESVMKELKINSRPIAQGTDDQAAPVKLPELDEFDRIPPIDAPVELEPVDMKDAGPLEMAPDRAVRLALLHRLDLRTSLGRVFDAQRQVTVAANALEAGLTLRGNATVGSGKSYSGATSPNVNWDPKHGIYTAGLILDLPVERTAETVAYRNSYIRLQQAVRDLQATEDGIKLDIRNELRDLTQSRESLKIQVQAVELAMRRLDNSQEQLRVGRAEVRDVLEAQDSLVSAQNARTAALVSYRVAELQLQRDMGVLQVDANGLWIEYDPNEPDKLTSEPQP